MHSLRDQRRDASQRGLLVGELCESIARVSVCDCRRDKLREIGQSSLDS